MVARKGGLGIQEHSMAPLPTDLVRDLSRLISSVFADKVTGSVFSTAFNLDRFEELISYIDERLALNPGNTDFLLAKSSVLRTAMQWKSGEDVVDEILRRDPGHFDARLIKDEWETWPRLLQCPACWEDVKQLPPALCSAASRGSVVLVRDGISLGVALVQDVSEIRLDEGRPEEWHCKWEFVASDTPYGRIVAHYGYVGNPGSSSYLQEGILQTAKPAQANGQSGYWLLQRLARSQSSLMVLFEGDRVVFSKRFLFPERSRIRFQKIAKLIEDDPKPIRNQDDLRKAVAWHAAHFDDTTMTFKVR